LNEQAKVQVMSSAALAPGKAPSAVAPPPKKSRTDGVEYNFCYALKQQLLRAWQPVPTLGCGIIMFFLLGLIFGAGGAYLYILNGNIWEYRGQYDNICGGTPSCQLTFSVPADKTNVYIYYEINGFYQSHRKFFGSKSQTQLLGNSIVEADASSCKPVIKNSDLYKKTNWNNSAMLDPTKVAYPCGAFARAMFNGTVSN
jgi:LEM3 (ligand-effect modulator 3) family / CDC50 family